MLLVQINGISNIRACEYGKYPIVYVFHAILGTGIWWLVSYLITQISWNNRLWKGMVWVIIYIGRNSMLFVCLNQLPIAVCGRFIGDSILLVFMETVVIIAGLIVLNQLILKSPFRFIIGKQSE